MHSNKAAPTGMIVLAFAAVYVIWGSTYLAIRWCVESMPPLLMAGTRFLLAGIILLLLARRFDKTPITRAQWAAAAIVGVLLLVGGNGLVCWAEKTIPSGIAGLLIATTPLWFALLEWLLFRGARPTVGVFSGIAIGLLGMYLLIDPIGSSKWEYDIRGVTALFCACFSWALGSLYSRRAPRPSSPSVATGMQMLCGGVALLIVSYFAGDWARFDYASVTMRAWVSWAYLLFAGSIVAFSAYVWLLRVCTPSLVSTYAFVNPLIAVGLGWLAGETSVTPRTALAMGVVLVGVVVITLNPGKSRTTVPTKIAAQPSRTVIDTEVELTVQSAPAERV